MMLGSSRISQTGAGGQRGNFEVGTAYYPAVNEDDKGGVSIGGASLWALNNKDEKKAAATWRFIKFLISPESPGILERSDRIFPGCYSCSGGADI